VQNNQRFASFFAFGAVNKPIKKPPAFFVTKIGDNLGINRQLVVPTDLSHFDEYPFVKALDPAAQPNPDPMAEITALSTTFPMERVVLVRCGLSFNSLPVTARVVSVQVGDGLQIVPWPRPLALPRPEVALVRSRWASSPASRRRRRPLGPGPAHDNSWLSTRT
jgi:hypothetical protein